MNNFKKSQLLLLSLLVVLLTIAPLLSSSIRPTYLYFITNLLIIALGAEAGLLSFFSKPLDEKKNAQKLLTSTTQASPSSLDRIDEEQKIVPDHQISTEKKQKAVEKSFSEKIVGAVRVEKVKKCPSTPSLFFIGGGEPSEGDHMSEDHYYEEEEKELGDLSGQELFTKAEMFIGNFYRQLKMQREESWKKINGFYQRAF